MSARWSPDDSSGFGAPLPASLSSFLALLGVASVLGLVVLGGRLRTLQSEVDRLSATVDASTRRERELEATVARQHQALLQSEGDLEMLRFQMDAVELQLDGIDYLSREVRAELDLSPGEGTWSNESNTVTPQGGGNAPVGPERERVSRAQRRLAAGLSELTHLLQRARARRAAAALSSGQAPPELVKAAPVPPANWPARGTVTSAYGWRIFGGRPNYHTGVDVALDYGTPVQATGDAVVVGSGWQPGYGWSVLLQHPMGYNTLYAHLADPVVELGDNVGPGDVVGFSGSSGRSTGPHLHYEIWKDGQPIDPRPFMDGIGPR